MYKFTDSDYKEIAEEVKKETGRQEICLTWAEIVLEVYARTVHRIGTIDEYGNKENLDYSVITDIDLEEVKVTDENGNIVDSVFDLEKLYKEIS